MFWFVLIVLAFLACCVMAIWSKAARVIVAVVFLLIFIGVGWYQSSEAQRRKKAEQAKRLIPMQQVVLTDTRMSISLGSSGYMTARIRNENDRYTITELELTAWIEECNPGCARVGEDSSTVYVKVPPHQVRGIEPTFYFRNLPKLESGKWTWNYRLESVSAE